MLEELWGESLQSLGFDEGEAPEAVERLENELRSAVPNVDVDCECSCELHSQSVERAAPAEAEAAAADLLDSKLCRSNSGDLSRSLRYCSVSAGSTSESRACEQRRVTTSSNVFRSRVSESC